MGKPSKWREECPLVFSASGRVLRENGREHFQQDMPSGSHRGHGDIGSEQCPSPEPSDGARMPKGSSNKIDSSTGHVC